MLPPRGREGAREGSPGGGGGETETTSIVTDLADQ